MGFPFSMSCECCDECGPCPCKTDNAASSLQFSFDGWSAAPVGYCNDCSQLNATIGAELDTSLHYTTQLGDGYGLTEPKAACTIDPSPGTGCMYFADEQFECVPQACLETCISGCSGSCTTSGDCSKENCENYVCGSDEACLNLGGTCEIECSQTSICVFDEELDPEHLAGSCADVEGCSSSVVDQTCRKIRLRLRAMFYVTEDRKGALSVQVLLFGRTIGGSVTALNLYGFHEFEEEKLECGLVDVELSLLPVGGYSQPAVAPCSAPTSVRILGVV